MTLICDNEIELDNMQVSRMEVILEDLKMWKDFKGQIKIPKVNLSL